MRGVGVIEVLQEERVSASVTQSVTEGKTSRVKRAQDSVEGVQV